MEPLTLLGGLAILSLTAYETGRVVLFEPRKRRQRLEAHLRDQAEDDAEATFDAGVLSVERAGYTLVFDVRGKREGTMVVTPTRIRRVSARPRRLDEPRMGWTGDPRFDRALALEGSGVDIVVWFTDALRREAVCCIRSRGWTLHEGEWRRTVRTDLTPGSVDQWLAMAHALGERSSLPDRPDHELLEERMVGASEAVRAELVRARLTLTPPMSPRLQEQLLAVRDRSSLLVALQRPDREVVLLDLAEHTSSGNVCWEALELLKDKTDPRVAAGYARFLGHHRYGTEAIERLGRFGTVQQVPALRKLADRSADDRASAKAAIRRIQERVGPNASGQLSLVDGSTGGLAVVDEGGGAGADGV